MRFTIYNQFGNIYSREYKFSYCDKEQFVVRYQLIKLTIVPGCIHRHKWSQKHNKLHDQNKNKTIDKIGKETYEARKARGFDMEVIFSASVIR